MIHNPIIPGFAGDPSIVRVQDDYYIATSSFEWFPGVPIYHSRDLKNWKLEDYALKDKMHLDLTGVQPSAGVWAPCLSYCSEDKTFYLVYSIVHNNNNWYFDVDNYLITSKSIHGPWCEPIYLCSSGFDYSLFHDTDGRKWLVGKDRDFRSSNIDKRPIILVEYDPETKKLLGSPIPISRGVTQRSFVEGPHIYKRNGFYYLMTAEGGTGYGHAVTVSRSRSIYGPYTGYPGNPVITSQPKAFTASECGTSFIMFDKYNPDSILQKSGHASLVETQNGEWYAVHLCARPVLPELRCILGRETSIQKMKWTDDDWLVMEDGTNIAKSEVPEADLSEHRWESESERTEFSEGRIPLFLQSPRNEISDSWAKVVSERKVLSIRGGESLTSNYYPSILARKLTSVYADVTVRMSYDPESYRHRAGLLVYYDTSDHAFIYESYDESRKRKVIMTGAQIDRSPVDSEDVVEAAEGSDVWFRCEIRERKLQFLYSLDGKQYTCIGPEYPTLGMSDEGGRFGRFTGTYVGMYAEDTWTKSNWADFHWFEYRPLH